MTSPGRPPSCQEVGQGIGATLRCDLPSGHVGDHHCPLTGATWGRPLSGDDHPRSAPHVECEVVHGPPWYAIPRHCRCGGHWPCSMNAPARTTS